MGDPALILALTLIKAAMNAFLTIKADVRFNVRYGL
jgi:hypothetical protein